MSVRSIEYNFLTTLLLAAFISACGSTNRSAPIFDRAPAPVVSDQLETRTDGMHPQRATTKQVSTNNSTEKTKPKGSTSREEAPANAKMATSEQNRAAEPAPVISQSKSAEKADWRPEYYTVRKGDTLYSIALDFGHDYRDLATWNNLADAAYIQVGQRLRLSPRDDGNDISVSLPKAMTSVGGDKRSPSVSVPTFADPKAYRSAYSDQALNEVQRLVAGEVETAVVVTTAAESRATPPPTANAAPTTAPVVVPSPTVSVITPSKADERLKWEWPASGALLYGFAKGPIKKGVGITGQPGQAVVSSAPGKVVYSGSGLRGYGNLIIVKHNATYLSVYAHNQQLLVSEGQLVAQGQKIAVMGEISSGRIGLHFEIRRLGKPMDPLKYLPGRSS